MPYVKADDRKRLSPTTESISQAVITGPGDLNYLYSLLNRRYLEIHALNYQHLNDIVGALEGAKLEIYRRIVEPYEDQKLESNGEVFW